MVYSTSHHAHDVHDAGGKYIYEEAEMPEVQTAERPTFLSGHIALKDWFEITDCGDRTVHDGNVASIVYRLDECWSISGIIDQTGQCICELGPDVVVERCDSYCTCDGKCIQAFRIHYADNRCLVIGRPALTS